MQLRFRLAFLGATALALPACDAAPEGPAVADAGRPDGGPDANGGDAGATADDAGPDAATDQVHDAGEAGGRDAALTDASADGAPLRLCDFEARAEPYTRGMTFTGDDGTQISVVSDPEPPGVGDHAWTLTVSAPDGGLVSGATLKAVPFMPDMGHGSILPVVEETAPGVYRAAPVRFTMPGYWEVTVKLTAGATTRAIVVKQCID